MGDVGQTDQNIAAYRNEILVHSYCIVMFDRTMDNN
jgi:hypothetical protein